MRRSDSGSRVTCMRGLCDCISELCNLLRCRPSVTSWGSACPCACWLNRETSNRNDPQWDRLSHVGQSVYGDLQKYHSRYRGDKDTWNLTADEHEVEILQTPPSSHWGVVDFPAGQETNHSDAFPERMGDIIAGAERWVDITTLWEPEGKFMHHFRRGLRECNEHAKERKQHVPVVIRIMFANIADAELANMTYCVRKAFNSVCCGNLCQAEWAGLDCDKVLNNLVEEVQPRTHNMPPDENADCKLEEKGARIQVWVGSWRKGMSWNHSKIIAADGRVCLTGGHNIFDDMYLKTEPCLDLSMVVTGAAAEDAHYFTNNFWQFITRKHVHECWASYTPGVCLHCRVRVGLSHWPRTAEQSPPMWPPHPRISCHRPPQALCGGPVNVISCGRYGAIYSYRVISNWFFGRPKASDTAIMAMLGSAKESIKIGVQDVGPGQWFMGWPRGILEQIARALLKRKVQVDIVLSNPWCYPCQTVVVPDPDRLGMNKCIRKNKDGECERLPKVPANIYGYGWGLDDFAAALARVIWNKKFKAELPKLGIQDEVDLAARLQEKLRLATLRVCKRGNDAAYTGARWPSGEPVATHTKSFIVDDTCYYLGSQNLYNCNNAEWGYIVDNKDNKDQAETYLEEYWKPMWKYSYEELPEDQRYKFFVRNEGPQGGQADEWLNENIREDTCWCKLPNEWRHRIRGPPQKPKKKDAEKVIDAMNTLAGQLLPDDLDRTAWPDEAELWLERFVDCPEITTARLNSLLEKRGLGTGGRDKISKVKLLVKHLDSE